MQGLLGATLILLAALRHGGDGDGGVQVPALLGYLAVGVVLGPSVIGVIAPGDADFLSRLGVALLLFWSDWDSPSGTFGSTVLVAGALQMVAVAAPLTLLLMGFGAARLRALRCSALRRPCRPRRWSADNWPTRASSPPATAAAPSPCWSFGIWPACPCCPLAIWGARRGRRRSRQCCSKCWACWCCSQQRRLLPAVCCMACWAGWRGGATKESFVLVSLCVVVAAARRCTQGSAYPPP